MPTIALVKGFQSLHYIVLYPREGGKKPVSVHRSAINLSREEAIAKSTEVLDKSIAIAKKRIEEFNTLKEQLLGIPELPPSERSSVAPVSKSRMLKAGDYIYLLRDRSRQLPAIAQAKMEEGSMCCHYVFHTQEGQTKRCCPINRSDMALSKEEAIGKSTTALNKLVKVAQKRIEECNRLKDQLLNIPELPTL